MRLHNPQRPCAPAMGCGRSYAWWRAAARGCVSPPRRTPPGPATLGTPSIDAGTEPGSSGPARRWLPDGRHRLHSMARRARPGVGACPSGPPTADAPALDALGGQRGRRPSPTARSRAGWAGGGVCSSPPHRLQSAPRLWSGRPASMSGRPPAGRAAHTPRAPRGHRLSRSAPVPWGGRGRPAPSSPTIRATPAPRPWGALASRRSWPRSAGDVPAPSAAWRAPAAPAPRVRGTAYAQAAP
jgi:hypothetical protein